MKMYEGFFLGNNSENNIHILKRTPNAVKIKGILEHIAHLDDTAYPEFVDKLDFIIKVMVAYQSDLVKIINDYLGSDYVWEELEYPFTEFTDEMCKQINANEKGFAWVCDFPEVVYRENSKNAERCETAKLDYIVNKGRIWMTVYVYCPDERKFRLYISEKDLSYILQNAVMWHGHSTINGK